MSSSSSVQQYIAHTVVQQLSDQLGTKVEVGSVRYDFPNKFSIKELYIEDTQQDTLLSIGEVELSLTLWKLFQRQLVCHSVEIQQMEGGIKIEKNGASNIDFLLQALATDSTEREGKIAFDLHSIRIKDSSWGYDNEQQPTHKPIRGFDPKHISLKGINGHLSLRHTDQKRILLQVHSLSMEEQSGFAIKDLKTTIEGSEKGIETPRLFLALPHSEITLDSIAIGYDSIADMRDFTQKVHLYTHIRGSDIVLSDLSAFFPQLKNFVQPIRINGKIEGKVSNIKLKEFQLTYGKRSLFSANIDLNGLPKLEETFVYADIQQLRFNRTEMQDMIAGMLNQPFTLPSELSNLGIVEYRGNLTGFFSNLVSYGAFYTQLGSMHTDISVQLENRLQDIKYSGTLTTQGFELGKLLQQNAIGHTSFNINTKGEKMAQQSLKGTVKGEITSLNLNQYDYQHIKLDGEYDGNGFDGHLTIDDPNADIEFYGLMDWTHRLPLFNFGIKVKNIQPHNLNLTPIYAETKLAFDGNILLVGNSIDDMEGFLELDSFVIENEKKKFHLQQLKITTDKKEEQTTLHIASDIVNGEVKGKFNYSTIIGSTKRLIGQYLPALTNPTTTPKSNDKLSIDLKIEDTEPIADVLSLPLGTKGTTDIIATIDSKNNNLNLQIHSPSLRIGKNQAKEIDITLNNRQSQLNLLLNGHYLLPNDTIDIGLLSTALQDSIQTQLEWKNHHTSNFEGVIKTNTRLKPNEDHSFTTHISIEPTEMTFSDSLWQVKPATIALINDSLIKVQNFNIQNQSQQIQLDGIISTQKDQKLATKLNDIEIGFWLHLIGFTPVEIAGRATGEVNLYQLLQKPAFEGNLNVANVHLNSAYIGEGEVHTSWNNIDQIMNVSGIFNNKKQTSLIAKGNYDFKNDSLDFTFDTRQVELTLLRKWLDNILKDVNGKGSGLLRLYGKSNNIRLQGDIFAQEATLTIDYLNTTYHFSDTVHLYPKEIAFKEIIAKDTDGNSGIVNGSIEHDGNFQQMTYHIDVVAKEMMALNTTSKKNNLFYGKAYASGGISIFGDADNTHIEVNAKTDKKTNINITVGNGTLATENSFVTFVQQDSTINTKKEKKQLPQKQKSNLHLTLLLDVTPDANLQLITNTTSGDMIAGSGNGNLRLEYNDKKKDLKLYGNYTIDRGEYTFTLQELIRKQFNIAQGSSIKWSGDILQATLDLKATYSLTASLRDLMDLDIVSTGRTSVPVNCVLKLTDQLTHPTINFDIDLPSSDETLKMQVKNLINTQELLNRQMVYLLLFNKFYTPSYANASSFDNNTDTGWTFLSSTLSGQLNNWLSKLSNNLTLGLNYRSSGYGQEVSQEYEAAVMLQPNNRLIVNGNIGYRDDLLAKNKIIGDVDVEYMLTENKKWRIKAYNHTVDRYSLRSAPFIQGVGIMYKKDFDTWRELWNKLLKKKQQKNRLYENNNDTIR